jgi:methylenetetrahydrofolate dehydrogenase (NADP+)/methenyltetrahydrofolate cyclohydrolase
MSAKIIDGAAVAQALRERVAEQIVLRVAEGRRPPGLAFALIGDDPASQVYVKAKARMSTELASDRLNTGWEPRQRRER